MATKQLDYSEVKTTTPVEEVPLLLEEFDEEHFDIRVFTRTGKPKIDLETGEPLSHYQRYKDAHLRYQDSEKGKAAREKYMTSEKGKNNRKRYQKDRREEMKAALALANEGGRPRGESETKNEE